MLLAFKIVLVLAVALAIIGLGANRLQRVLMYVPDTERVSPQAAGLINVEEISLKTDDGAQVLAWWSRAKPGQPTLLYFHGNAGSLATRSERLKLYQDAGVGVLMMTYRGYGGSTGTPTEKSNVSDGKQAYAFLRQSGVPADQIIVYGESLGTGVAVQVAADKTVAGLILDAPYTSMVDLAELHYPILPSRFFMTDRYQSIVHIKNVTAPLLVIHGARDVTVPATMGKALFDAANEPKQIEILPEAGHSDHYLHGTPELVFAWLLQQHSAKGAATPRLDPVRP
jgi:uncharacterized protein